MKKRIYKEILALTMASVISGCGYPKDIQTPEEVNVVESDVDIDEVLINSEQMDAELETLEKTISLDEVYSVPSVVTNELTYMYDDDGNQVGLIPKNVKLEILNQTDDSYEVNYHGTYGFISGNLNNSYINKIDKELISIGYLKNDSLFFTNDDRTISNMVSKLESCYIYDIVDEFYFVNIDGTFGYIPASDIEILTGKFVIVDKSDQEAKIYQDNVLLYATPVITGTPTEERESDEGIFEIYDISHNRDLVGPGYRSYVDVMLKYNGGEGLHDAEYHINEDGKKHGWKSIEDFGGDTYLTAGSHGCINMPNEAAIFAYNTLELNDKVLVKK